MNGAARATPNDTSSRASGRRIPWRGSVRVTMLMLGALRLQRWLLGAGALLTGIGFLVEPPEKYALVILGLVLALVPLFFVGGMMMRYFVAPRGLHLVPHARVQMLGGMMLLTLVITTTLTLAAWGAGFPTDRLGILWLRLITATSLALLSQFVLATSFAGMMVWFVSIIGAVSVGAQMLQIAAPRAAFVAIANSEGLLAAITLGAWIPFAVWFLRTRSFKSPTEVAMRGTRVAKVNVSPGAAIRAWLFGNPSFARQFSGSLIMYLLVGGIWTLLAVIGSKSVHSFAEAFARLSGIAFMLGVYAGLGGFMVAQRSKYLWLRTGVDRNGLFRLCEQQAWRFFGATAVSLVLLLAIAWAVNPERGPATLLVLLFQLSVGVCMLYIGLMHVTGWRVFDVLCMTALTLFLIITMPVMANIMERLWLLPELFGGMAVFAFIARLIAVSRWERIDWLVCRPPKVPARGVTSAS